MQALHRESLKQREQQVGEDTHNSVSLLHSSLIILSFPLSVLGPGPWSTSLLSIASAILADQDLTPRPTMPVQSSSHLAASWGLQPPIPGLQIMAMSPTHPASVAGGWFSC